LYYSGPPFKSRPPLAQARLCPEHSDHVGFLTTVFAVRNARCHICEPVGVGQRGWVMRCEELFPLKTLFWLGVQPLLVVLMRLSANVHVMSPQPPKNHLHVGRAERRCCRTRSPSEGQCPLDFGTACARGGGGLCMPAFCTQCAMDGCYGWSCCGG
jgi:hypothetical protein